MSPIQGLPLPSHIRAQILSPITGVKASYEVGLKSTQTKGCPMSMLHKCVSSKTYVKSAPNLSLPLPRTLPFLLLVVPFLNNWGNIRRHWRGKLRLNSWSMTGGIKSTMALGCCTGSPGYIGWRAGTTTLCQSRFYPPAI
jgi:hypothetical protein